MLTEQYCYSEALGLHAKTIPAGQMNAGYYPYLKDEEGNVIGVVDFAQIWRMTYEYSAFGTLVASGGQAPINDYFRYKSARLDSESGGYNMYRRMFQPGINRYTQSTNLLDTNMPSATFLGERPIEFAPDGGYVELSSSMTGDIDPSTQLAEVLPSFRHVYPLILQCRIMQWQAPFALIGKDKMTANFGSVANLPTCDRELEGMYMRALNDRLRLIKRDVDRPRVEIPVRPIAVEDDSFTDQIEQEIEVF